MKCIELCAGAGGMALGLERAGYEHVAMIENDPSCCNTLRSVRRWARAVRQVPLQEWAGVTYRGSIDLVAGGIPCPPFSRAGLNRGGSDGRDLFPDALRVVRDVYPRHVLFENVPGMLTQHADYLEGLQRRLGHLGYRTYVKVLDAADFGVPQVRKRLFIVGTTQPFDWPEPSPKTTPTVGYALRRQMSERGWDASEWAAQADRPAPTLVGGSKLHGGPDLGPTQARAAWARMGVDGRALADEAPDPGHEGPVRLTVAMAAKLQGFPLNHPFQGGKTARYQQVGNALPPALAFAVAAELKGGA